MKIEYDAVIGSGAGQWYGQIIVSDLRYEDGSAVQVNQYLAMTFNAPAAISDTDIYMSFAQSWVSTGVSVQSVQIDSNLFSISATLDFAQSHLMDVNDRITIGVNGDLTKDPNAYLGSFVIAADAAPDVSGAAAVTCSAAPDPALSAVAPIVKFIRGSEITPVTLEYGATVNQTLAQGDYTIQGDNVSTVDETVIAPLVIAPAEITVSTNTTVPVNVSFGATQLSSALDIAIGALTGLETETLKVTLVDTTNDSTLAAFTSRINTTTSLRLLPASGTAELRIDDILVNNVDYSFQHVDIVLANQLQTIAITDLLVDAIPIDTTGFVTVPVHVTADATLTQQITLRLSSGAMNYTQTIDVETQLTCFDVPVKPDTYTVSAEAFLFGGMVYTVDTPAELVVTGATPAPLEVSIQASANLNVPGFPPYLSFGGCADLTPGNQADFVSARASSVFKYAGNDGAGDPNTYLTNDPATTTTINLARSIETALGGQPVLPVMISYTCNLSLGNTPGMLANADQHAHSFANLILTLNTANTAIDGAHPVPTGIIVNPDFISACQQGGISASYAMPVRTPLQTALDHWAVDVPIPSSITEDVTGYVAAVNWLFYTVAPKIVFGWQVNLWGVGRSEWIYEDADPLDIAQQTAAYIDNLAVYHGPWQPHFLAIDRYEADDFTQRAYVNGYCYGPREWDRYFDFCQGLSRALKLPVMPWQIPASRTPNTGDLVNADFDSQHWGTGGSCILGDPAIGADYHNVHPAILALQFPSAFTADMGATAEDMFIRSEPFDISRPVYSDFPLRGIFAVLLGGGSTTGIISTVGNPEPWTRNKLNAYMDDPIRFDNASGRRG
ncbi:hypothetical protein [Paraburkholderia rhizosphaerae]|uniref:Hydroxymethyltransferase n=1 Tax=Paraburkholderia rhizosphaerae TaxID=480658 RepID=A0A4R8L7Q6_9BURK|nr:hypothetical protein [Paraburkholderia rhizosphaerae]TDY38776.1 hypothetical protein BX592_1302 [Paraburkholderia rhizosphaerae]